MTNMRDANTTTSYGSFYNATRSAAETSILELAMPTGWEGDTDALESAARTKLAELLAGTGISLHGDEFYGPAYPSAAEQAAQAALIARKGETANLWQDDDEDLTPQAVAVALLAEDEGWWLSVFDDLDGSGMSMVRYVALVTDQTPENLEYGTYRGWVLLDEEGCWLANLDEADLRALSVKWDAEPVDSAYKRTGTVGGAWFRTADGEEHLILHQTPTTITVLAGGERIELAYDLAADGTTLGVPADWQTGDPTVPDPDDPTWWTHAVLVAPSWTDEQIAAHIAWLNRLDKAWRSIGRDAYATMRDRMNGDGTFLAWFDSDEGQEARARDDEANLLCWETQQEWARFTRGLGQARIDAYCSRDDVTTRGATMVAGEDS